MNPTLPKATGKWVIITILCTRLSTSAGQAPPIPPPQIGVGLSAYSYLGDLNPALGTGSMVNPGLDVSLQFSGQALIGPELHAGIGRFIAQAPPIPGQSTQANTFVQTDLSYADLRLHLLLFRQYRLKMFAAAGTGILLYTPKDQAGYSLIDNTKSRAAGEEYNGTVVFFPVSAGFRYRLSQRATLSLETTMRWTRTDYLDNISQLGARQGNDRMASVTASCQIRLGDFYLRKMEQQIGKQEREVVAAMPASLFTGSKTAEMTRQAIDNHRFVYYRARKGENPDSLASRTGLSKEILRHLNYLPASGALPEAFNMRIPNVWYLGVKKAFPDAYIADRVEAREFLYYTVSPDDTFGLLSARYGVTEEVLRKINFIPQGEPESGSLLRLPLIYFP